MKESFPELPSYSFSWRSIQVEPIPFSGERITLGTVIKGQDQALLAAKLVDSHKIKSIYGQKFGKRIADALAVCKRYAEEFYSEFPLSEGWIPPLEGFYLGEVRSSVAENIEEALLIAASYCSSFSISPREDGLPSDSKSQLSTPESWRNEIFKAVTVLRSDFAHCFKQEVRIRGSGVPLKFGFLSANYAAQFDAVTESKNIQNALVRAQSKLWQLDRLRDNESLFKPELCELLLGTPILTNESTESSELSAFVEEIKYEASKREINIFSTPSYSEAAEHIVEKAA